MIALFANSGGSGEIRGRQVAAYLGPDLARLNPEEGFADDVCIWVKRQPPEDYPAKTWVDILDAHERLGWLKRHPHVGVIASSLSGKLYLERVLGRVVRYIPQHHCNFERVAHEAQSPPRLGCVGGRASLPDTLAADMGAVRYGAYRTRQDVVAAYGEIDVQIVWRGLNRPLKNALKIINAASFGIPTVALPEPGYLEMRGGYIPCRSEARLGAAIEDARALKASTLRTMAEEFHISRIADRYTTL